MAKSLSRRPSAPAGLFDAAPALPPAPVRLPVARSLAPAQQARVRLVADSLQRDITRFQGQLARPLASWDEQEHQTVEANVALAFALKAVAEFLPADLQPLIAQFVDLRTQVILREFEEG